MGANASLRSLGTTGAMVAQAATAGMSADGLYGSGFIRFDAEARVLATPVALVSADELHPFLSLQYQSGPAAWSPLIELGATPSGRVRCVVASGADAMSAPSLLTAASGWHSISVAYGPNHGTLALVMDGVEWDATDAGAPLLPPTGEQMRLVLFNGATMNATTEVALRRLTATAVPTTGAPVPKIVTWNMREHGGGTLLASVSDGEFPGIDFSLVVNDLDAFRWDIHTDWTARVRPTTRWTKAGAA